MSIINVNELEVIDFNIDNYSEVYDHYREDIQSYIAAFSGGRKDNSGLASRHLLNKLTYKWQPILGFTTDKILGDIRELQTPKIDRVTSLTLREALKYYKPGSNWLIPNLIRSVGLYILAGEPKAGKSWFVYHIMYAIAVSQQFLGRPVKTGRILFLQLEEPLETISERLFLSGFGDMTSEETSLIVNFMDTIRIERSFDVTSDTNWLINLIDEYKPVLVIIDSLRMATLKSNASENSNEMGKSVYALQQVFNFTNTCGILIHHMSKLSGRNSKKIGLIERIAGHTSITSATDGLLGITSEETNDGRLITLKTLPRNGISITIQYKMITTEGGLCELEKVYEDTPASLPVTGKILRFLGNSPDTFFSARLIGKGIDEISNSQDFKEALTYLQNSQIISSRYYKKCFQYCLTSDSLWLVNPTDITEDLQTPAILDANALMRCTTKRELRSLISDWDAERRASTISYLFSTEVARIKELMFMWEFEVGDEVIYEGEVYTIDEQLGNPGLSKSKYRISGASIKEVLEVDLQLAENFSDSEFDEELELSIEQTKPSIDITSEEVQFLVDDDEHIFDTV